VVLELASHFNSLWGRPLLSAKRVLEGCLERLGLWCKCIVLLRVIAR